MSRRSTWRKAAQRRPARTRNHSTGSSLGRSLYGRSNYARRLRLEPLEDRRLLALVTVNTLADTVDFNDGATSLREAIFATNTVPGADTIEFAPLASSTNQLRILLTQGELVITEALTIQGPGADRWTIDAQQRSRIFNITATTGDFTIAGLTLIGGRTIGNSAGFYDTTYSGGAIRSLTTDLLTLSHSAVSGNSTAGNYAYGGGVYARGNVTLSESTVSGNSTRGSVGRGGGIFAYGNMTLTESTIVGNSTKGGFAHGGGVLVVGNLTLSQSTVSSNSTGGDIAHGGGIYCRGNVTLTETVVNGNSTAGELAHGGGILANSNVVLAKSIISGNATRGDFARGGGIYARGNVFLTQCTVSSNSATGDSVYGGGIRASGNVTIARSTVTGNSAAGVEARGGGIFARRDVMFSQSTVSGNTTTGYLARGGGIYAIYNVAISHSSISGNSTAGDLARGGGISANRDVTLAQSTVTGNSTAGDFALGGGIYAGSVTVTRCTVIDNHATGGGSMGGGLWVQRGSISGSIVASNTAARGTPDLRSGGTLIVDYSLIGDNAGTTLVEAPLGSPDANGNLIGGSVHGVIDPVLGPLADNGGFELPDGSHILTLALLPGSPAINAGDLNVVAGAGAGVIGVQQFDQRGEPFGRVVGGRIDIGAFEYQTPTDLNLLVDTLVDESDGDYSRGDLSLREAIELANASYYPDVIDTVTDTIRFDPALIAEGPATILLSHGELAITDRLTIDGPGAKLLTIDASGNDPTPHENNGDGSVVFNVDDSQDVNPIAVLVSGMTLTGGDGAYGGAVFNYEDLTITDSTITGNSTATLGGGALSLGGSLRLLRSTVADNFAGSYGGGIASFDSVLILRDSTVSGNTADAGGGIYAYRGFTTVERSIISRNTATLPTGIGGGMHGRGGTIVVLKSQITGNSARDAGGIYSQHELRLVESTVTGNHATKDGGGIVGRGKTLLERSTVSDNDAGRDGGGIWSKDELSVQSSTIARNSAVRDGGGVWLEAVDATVKFVQATVSGNHSMANGAGVWIANAHNRVVSIAHSTIAANEVLGSGLGGGVFLFQGPVTLNHTIVAKNYAPAGPDLTGLFGASIAARYSLIGDNANSGLTENHAGMPDANGNLIGGGESGTIDPLLGELKYNGGPTPTHALPSPQMSFSFPSPAVDTGDPQAASDVNGVPVFDQRGAPFVRVADGDRRSGARIDIGAFETQNSPSLPTLYGDYSRNGRVDAADFTVWRNNLGKTVASYTEADGNGDGEITWADYDVWKGNFGSQANVFVPIGGGSAAGLATLAGPEETGLQSKPPAEPEAGPTARQVRAGIGGPLRHRAPVGAAARQDRLLEGCVATRDVCHTRTALTESVAAGMGESETDARAFDAALECLIAELPHAHLEIIP